MNKGKDEIIIFCALEPRVRPPETRALVMGFCDTLIYSNRQVGEPSEMIIGTQPDLAETAIGFAGGHGTGCG